MALQQTSAGLPASRLPGNRGNRRKACCAPLSGVCFRPLRRAPQCPRICACLPGEPNPCRAFTPLAGTGHLAGNSAGMLGISDPQRRMSYSPRAYGPLPSQGRPSALPIPAGAAGGRRLPCGGAAGTARLSGDGEGQRRDPRAGEAPEGYNVYKRATIAATGSSFGYVNLIADLEFSNSGNSFRGVKGTCAANDQWRVGGAGTADNAGYMEIATADDITEPIYVRQYTGAYTTLNRTATLLDASGNTTFPGSVTTGNKVKMQYNSTSESLDFIFI